ncbi:MAG: ABC transporter ATP-binding protein [Patescibacteria group bacterium]
MLEIKNLSKSINQVNILNKISFVANEGEVTAIIGGNGAGKSTLFNLISGVLGNEMGEVIFNGSNIEHLPPFKRANMGLSRTFQLNGLFSNLSVYENLLLAIDYNQPFWVAYFGIGKNAYPKDSEIRKVLELVNMTGHEKKLARNLSGGQQKLVELARSLIMPHKILLLDEPLAGVSPAMKVEILEVLKKLKEAGETILFIEHDIHFIKKIADKIITLELGEITNTQLIG